MRAVRNIDRSEAERDSTEATLFFNKKMWNQKMSMGKQLPKETSQAQGAQRGFVVMDARWPVVVAQYSIHCRRMPSARSRSS